jgi:hypothetical protein
VLQYKLAQCVDFVRHVFAEILSELDVVHRYAIAQLDVHVAIVFVEPEPAHVRAN